MDMDSSANTAQDELALLIDFIQTNVMRRTNPSPVARPPPIVTNPPRGFPLPEGGETILMPLAVQGLLSLLDSTPERAGSQLVERFISAVNEGATPYKNVLSEQGEEALRTIEFQEVEDTAPNKECPIFQTQFQGTQLVTQLPCKHCFEPEAIKHWLSTEKAECPICRYELPSKEIKDEEEEEDEDADERENFRVTTRFLEIDPEEEDLRLALLASMDDFNSLRP
tara:strand:- start:47746 stop:48420 length:675 start_codon:yes stop_codon:yes gene_type:complete